MRLTRVILIAATLLVFFALSVLGVMWVVIRSETVMIGGGMTSPDGRFYATLRAVVEGKPFGKSSSFYEFAVFGPASPAQVAKTQHPFTDSPLHVVRIPVEAKRLKKTRGAPPFPIQWNAQSTSVETNLENVNVVINLSGSSNR